jgi:tripartite ATP-independent transporter DctM subunit
MSAYLDLLMFAVACLVLLMGFPVAFTLAGVALAFGLIGQSLDMFDMGFFYALPQRIFGTMTNEVLIAVPLFVFMGTMLERARVAEDLLENMSRLFAGVRGGLGISVSIVGALLAASTGIVGATVVTMSLLSLPTMLRRGYAPSLAAGSIAAAGTLGQIIPPSIVLVLLGDVIANAYQKAQLEQGIFAPETVSVGELFSGSLIPGLVLVGLYIIYQVGLAIFKPSMAPPAEYDDDLVLADLLGALFAPVFLIVSVLGSILAGIATPTEAAAVGAVGTILLAGHKLGDRQKLMAAGAFSVLLVVVLANTFDLRLERDTIGAPDLLAIGVALALCGVIILAVGTSLLTTYRLGVLESTMRSTTHTTSMVFVILIGAALFSLVFRGLGGDDTIHDLLQSLPGGTWTAVAAVMLVMFLLGFFLDFIEIIFVVVPLVGPVLLSMGVDPVWLGVMMAINLQTSFLTPPFGFALFYLRGAAPESVRTGDIYRGAIPFVIIQLIMLALLAWIPEMATWLPEVVFGD